MTIREAQHQLIYKIQTIYDQREANNIAELIMENLTGHKRIDRMVDIEKNLTSDQEINLEQIVDRLLNHEPVQYILGETWFYGLKLAVDKNVLIPRPETEELVDWVLKQVIGWPMADDRNFKVFDVGTGSGCIAIALRKNLPPYFEIWACDNSDKALTVARKNADDHHALVDYVPLDFLDAAQRRQLPRIDIIVSNPPYIPCTGKAEMKNNVINYEPHDALFVPDNDPLVFYQAIADFGKENLYEGGSIYVEIQETIGQTVIDLFKSKGYAFVELKKDMQGKDRMVRTAHPKVKLLFKV